MVGRSGNVFGVVLACFSIMLASQVTGQLALPGVIYAATSDGKIYELNEDYSQKSLVVQTDLSEIRSIAINSSGEVYAVDRDSLYGINLSTGESTAITAAPTPNSQFDAISFGHSDQLYIVEATVNSSFWYRLQLYNFESHGFELQTWLSDNEDAFIYSLAIDPYTNTPYYIYRPPFSDYALLGEVQDPPYTPKTTRLVGVSGGNLHFDWQGRLAVVEWDRINYVDRFSGKIYARKSKEQSAYTDIASMVPPLEALPSVIVEAGQLIDFDEIATGGSGEQQISVANMSNDEVVISFSKTDGNGATLELPEITTLAPGERRSFNFRLHVETEGLLTGQLELSYGAGENEVINIEYQAVGFDVHPIDTDFLYAISRNAATDKAYLYRIDLNLNRAMIVCALSKPIEMLSASSEGVLYGVVDGYLHLVDAESGKAQKLTSIGFTPRSIAFDLTDSLYVPYIDLEDGSIPYVHLYKYALSTGELVSRSYTIVSGPGYAPGTGQIAVSPNGWVALLGQRGLAYGEDSLYSTESVFPMDQLKLELENLKDIVFYKDGSLVAYGTSIGKIDLKSSTFKPLSLHVPGFVGFVKHIPVIDLLEFTGSSIVTYPNPFNETLTMVFKLEEAALVTLEVNSISGQKITSISRDFAELGTTEITWNGRDAAGNRMKEGMFILRLVVNNKVLAVQRVLLEP